MEDVKLRKERGRERQRGRTNAPKRDGEECVEERNREEEKRKEGY